jgi:hypothetical protein
MLRSTYITLLVLFGDWGIEKIMSFEFFFDELGGKLLTENNNKMINLL